MDISLGDILKFAAQGGSSIILLVVWIYTQRSNDTKSKAATETASAQNKAAMETLQRAVDLSNETSKEAFRKHGEVSEQLVQLLKDGHERQELLIGILDRLEIKLSTPVSCPLAGIKGFNVEVKN